MLEKKWNYQQGQEQAGKECLLYGLPPEGETHEIMDLPTSKDMD